MTKLPTAVLNDFRTIETRYLQDTGFLVHHLVDAWRMAYRRVATVVELFSFTSSKKRYMIGYESCSPRNSF